MGGEFAQWTEWNHDSELDWALFGHENHDGIRRFVGDLNHRFRTEPSLYEADFSSDGFEWIQCDDHKNSVFAFIRYAKDKSDFMVIVGNFTPTVHKNYRVGVPASGFYKEFINSDAKIYGGSNVGNIGGLYSENTASHGKPQSINLTIPPLGLLVLKPVS